MEKRIEILKTAVIKAGKIIKSINPNLFIAEKESRGNFVTKADLESE